jgi:hypothetical protein
MIRNAISFIAYHAYMALPEPLSRRCVWMLPAVGWWAYREDRIAAQDPTP